MRIDSMDLTRLTLTIATLAVAGAANAQWTFISGEANASSYFVSTGTSGTFTTGLAGVAPPAFADSWVDGPEQLDFNPVFSLTIGDHEGAISSNVDGVSGAGYRFAHAETTIENVELIVGDPNDPFFTMSFDSIFHEVLMEGTDPENFTPVLQQTLTYQNVQMTYLGDPVTVPTNPDPGTYVIDTGKGGPYVFSVAMNDGGHGIEIGFSGVPTPGGGLSGIMNFGTVQAEIQAAFVPEPTGIAILAAGVFALCVKRRTSVARKP